jgi:hypothetical protein
MRWPSHCRSTPELEQLQAHLSALLPYRGAAELVQHLLPVDAGKSAETLRCHALALGQWLGEAAATQPPAEATAITVTLDSTFIRGRDDADRRLEVRVGNIENAAGQRQVLGVVTHAETDIASRKLWTALHEINGYLSSQSGRLVNYAERRRAGLRVGTSITEWHGQFSGHSQWVIGNQLIQRGFGLGCLRGATAADAAANIVNRHGRCVAAGSALAPGGPPPQ